MMDPTHNNSNTAAEIFVNEEWKQDSYSDDNNENENENENDNPSASQRPRTPFLFSKFWYSSLNKNENNDNNNNNNNSSERQASPQRWAILLLGQLIAFLMSSAGASQATLHLNCQISIPTLSTAFVYIVLAFSLVPYYYYYCSYYWSSHESSVSSQTVTTTTISLNENDHDDNLLQVQLDHQEKPQQQQQQQQQQQENAITATTNGTNNKSHPVACHSDALRIDNNPICTSSSSSSSHTTSSLPTIHYSLGGIIPLHSSVWSYMLISFLDVEANYVTVLAFQYTTITSVNLLDALAIPTAMIVSRLLLKRTYVKVHLGGALLCMMGIVMNVWSDRTTTSNTFPSDDNDTEHEQEEQYPHRVWGDVLAIGGGLLWGINNVVQEFVIQHSGNPLEVLGMIGFGGTWISIIQIAILERDDLQELFGVTSESDENDSMVATCNTRDKLLLLGAYIVCVSSVYVGGAYFLLYSEAALYNLSLLTSDAWTVLFSVVAEHIIPPPLFFVAMLLIVSGVVLYETGPSPIQAVELDDDDDNHNNDNGKQREYSTNDKQVELSVYQAETS